VAGESSARTRSMDGVAQSRNSWILLIGAKSAFERQAVRCCYIAPKFIVQTNLATGGNRKKHRASLTHRWGKNNESSGVNGYGWHWGLAARRAGFGETFSLHTRSSDF